MERIEGLNSNEKAFYEAIQSKIVEKACKAAPETPLSRVLQDSVDSYSRLHWILELNERFPSFKRDDYESMENTFGPDLTAMPRYRFASLKPSRSSRTSENTTKRLSGANLFVKENTGTLSERMAAWKALPEDQKAKYNERARKL